jgi:hypothetical protein
MEEFERVQIESRAELLAADLMMPPGLAAIEQSKQDGSWTVYDEIEELVIPTDLAEALGENETAGIRFGESVGCLSGTYGWSRRTGCRIGSSAWSSATAYPAL